LNNEKVGVIMKKAELFIANPQNISVECYTALGRIYV